MASVENVMLAIILGTLAAIIYALRVLVIMERRVARIDAHIEALVKRVLREEVKIEALEKAVIQKPKKK